MSARAGKALAAIVAAVALGVAPFVLSSFSTTLLTLGLIWALLATSLNVLVTYAGLPSLGHAAPFGVGAYAAGVLMTDHDVDSFFLALPVVLGAAVLVSAAIGIVALRTRGVHFLLITFAMAEMLRVLATQWRTVTGGDDGLAGITRPTLEPLSAEPVAGRSAYLFVLAVVALSVVLLLLIVRSPFGKVLIGLRESETRMSILGYNTSGYWLAAFAAAGMFAGLAGLLFAYHNGFVAPSELSPLTSLKALLFVILGGGTFFGPAVAAIAITFAEHYVSDVTDRWLFILGLLYIVASLLPPAKVRGFVRRARHRIARPSASTPAPAEKGRPELAVSEPVRSSQ